MSTHQAKASGTKKSTVKELAELLTRQEIIGVVNMENLPAAQQQVITAKLREHVTLYMTKIPLIKRAIDEASKKKPALAGLEEYITGMTALLFTKENPFKIYKRIKENKSPAAAKAGQKAPKEIIVKAGATSFAPGPIIGELGSVGIKAGIEGGKVTIKADSVVAKEGQEISAKLAGILLRLDIKPMEIGLNIRVMYENGTIYTRKVLDVDEEQLFNNLALAAVQASTLSLELGIITKENVELLLSKAFRHARALALDTNTITKETITDLIATAALQASTLITIEKN